MSVGLLAVAAVVLLTWQRPGKIVEPNVKEAAPLAQSDLSLDAIRAAGL